MAGFEALKPTRWFDSELDAEVYGIKVKHRGRWINLGERGEVIFFDTRKERDALIKKLRG
jgi:hypothetical protein